MLNAWHLPVAPFVTLRGERLTITLWLTGSALPTRVSLRAERDNEESQLAMTRLSVRRSPASAPGR